MIKLSIKNEPEPQEKKEFKGVLSLRKNANGSITLTMDDSIMPKYPWNLLSIKPDGTFSRAENLPDNIGLQVNNKGRIIEGESE